jgi:hypothetical protein
MTWSDPNVQLRLHYEQPLVPQRLRTSLRGQTVLVAPDDGDSQRAVAYLHSVGVVASLDEVGLISFPAIDLDRLLDLPERVVLIPTGDAGTLLHLLAAPEGPVLVTLDSPRVLNVSWVDETGECNEPLDVASTPALLSLGVPVVADQETWSALHAASALPAVLARARVNLDGFVELTTSVPQQVESLAIPGLFRLDETRFGLPLASTRHLDAVPGVLWDGPVPSYDPPPADVVSLPLALAPASRAHLRLLVERLAFSRSLAVVWPRGTGRRVFSLAAVEALDAYPLGILCRPALLWAWRRHLELLGRRPSLLTEGDVYLAPHEEAHRLTHGPSLAAAVLDDMEKVAHGPGNLHRLVAALAPLEGDPDTIRIAVSSKLPEDTDSMYTLFAALRPGEFRTGVPAASRYASPAEERLREHAELYVLRHTGEFSTGAFRRSEVVTVQVDDHLLRLIESLPDPGISPVRRRETLGCIIELLREGGNEHLGPKIPHALSLVTEALERDERVTVLTGSARCSRLLAGLLGRRASDSVRFIEYVPEHPIDADLVVVLEYPKAFTVLDDAVVEASDSRGPRRVVLLHTENSVEDRLAVVALVRSEFSGSRDPLEDFSAAEVEYLLGLGTLDELAAKYRERPTRRSRGQDGSPAESQ